MTRTAAFLLFAGFTFGGWAFTAAQDSKTPPAKTPSKGTPGLKEKRPNGADKGTPSKGDKARLPTDSEKPIPPDQMKKRFGGNPRAQFPTKPLLITGATVVTQSDAGTIVADVLVRDGKIAAVGKDLEAPEGAEKIAAAGMTVTPGLIDARGVYGLAAGEGRASASDASLDATDGLDSTTEDWRELLRHGVTAVYVQPGGMLGGAGAVVRVGPVRSADSMIVRKAAAVQAALNPQAGGGSTIARYSQYEQLKGAFASAKKYEEEWTKYREELKKEAEKKAAEKAAAEGKGDTKGESKGAKPDAKEPPKAENKEEPKAEKKESAEDIAKRMPNWDRVPEQFKKRIIDQIQQRLDAGMPVTFGQRGEGRGPGGGGPGGPKKPTVDPAKELLLRVLKREIPVRLETHRADDIRNAYALADEYKIRLILDGLAEPGRAASDVKDRRTPIVLGPFLELAEDRVQPAAAPALPQFGRGIPPELQALLNPPPTVAAAPAKFERSADWPKSLVGGNPWALATFASSPRESRLLRAHAATAVAMGLNPAEVLAAITKNAALASGVADRLGSVEVGKDADLAVFAGDPLSPATTVAFVVSGGQVIRTAAQPKPAEAIAFAAPESASKLPSKLPGRFAIGSKFVMNEKGEFAAGNLTVIKGAFGNASEPVERTVDLGDLYVTPGLIAGPDDFGQSTGGGDEAAASVGALVATDAFDPAASAIRRLRKGGFLHLTVAPTPNHATPGVCGSVRLGDPLGGGEMGPLFALTRGARNRERFPASLAAQVQAVAEALNGKRAELAFQNDEGRRYYLDPAAPTGAPVFFVAERPAEISAALEIAAAAKRTPVLVRPTDFRPRLADLKAANAVVVSEPLRPNQYDYQIDQLIAADKAGVRVTFGGETAAEIRAAASLCVAAGMSPNKAMTTLTAGGASALGMPKNVGSFAVGEAADFVVWTGPPWDLRSRVLAVVANGQLEREGD